MLTWSCVNIVWERAIFIYFTSSQINEIQDSHISYNHYTFMNSDVFAKMILSRIKFLFFDNRMLVLLRFEKWNLWFEKSKKFNIEWRLKLIEIKHINNYYYLDLNFNSTFETDMCGLEMAMEQGRAEGWDLCPRPAWIFLAPFPPRPAWWGKFLTPSLPLKTPRRPSKPCPTS